MVKLLRSSQERSFGAAIQRVGGLRGLCRECRLSPRRRLRDGVAMLGLVVANNLLLFFTGYTRSASSILQEQHEKSQQNDAGCDAPD